jgi:hypothetical protein
MRKLRFFLDEDIEIKEDKERKEEIEELKIEAVAEDACPNEKEVIEKG